MSEQQKSSPFPLGGYAPGNYHCKCANCEQTFTGDKKAVQCLTCAIIKLKEASLQRSAATPASGQREKEHAISFAIWLSRQTLCARTMDQWYELFIQQNPLTNG